MTQNSGRNTSSNSMATAAAILGVSSIILFMIGGGLTFGALGIILALLSRSDGRMSPPARIGCILSAVSMTVTVITLSSSLVYLASRIRNNPSEYNNILNEIYNNLGENFGDIIQEDNSKDYDTVPFDYYPEPYSDNYGGDAGGITPTAG